MAGYPKLSGDRVILRPVEADDADDVVRWRSDPGVASQFFSERPPTHEEHKAWVKTLEQRGDRHEYIILADRGTRPIGSIGLCDIRPDTRTAEYGILIGEADYRGKGMAREASDVILHYAFEVLGLERIYLNVFSDNEPALLLYHALGFQKEVRREPVYRWNGAVRETTLMCLSRAAWCNTELLNTEMRGKLCHLSAS